ncbi:hypothetical protein TNCV_2262571 [Trichonephila clavipes]|nr:hypothetical protein TNCV_2262571 [Trichonephila clavipes]
MQSIALITLQLLLVSGFVFAESSEESGESGESDYSDELDIDLRPTMCEGANEEERIKIVDCITKMDLSKHEDSIKECYADLADLSGESMQQWYCSHTDDENQQSFPPLRQTEAAMIRVKASGQKFCDIDMSQGNNEISAIVKSLKEIINS